MNRELVIATCKRCEQRFAIDTDEANHLRTDKEHCPHCAGIMPFDPMTAYLEREDGCYEKIPLRDCKRTDLGKR